SNDVEGAVSTCVDLTYSGPCSVQPLFDTDSVSAGSTLSASCKVALEWTPAASSCPLSPTINYSVQRSNSPYFTAPNTIASGLTAASYDDVSVLPAAPYYYRILAKDSEGNIAPISKTVVGTAVGASGVDGNFYLEDGDTHVYSNLESPWQVTNTAATSGSLSFHSGADGATYPASTCGAMTTPSIQIQPGASLNFKMKYNIEHGWDLLVLEVSANGGSTWTTLTPNGGYPAAGTITNEGNACGFPLGTPGFGGSTSATPADETAAASFQDFSASLAAYAGQSIKLRWRFSSDGGAEFGGAFIDEIRMSSERIFFDGFEPANTDYMCTPAL
ncbi:MAG: hypothetical protein ABI866_05370, partial [Dokdonella sp.]